MTKSKLTPKQETFCLVYIETGNATEAYRQAYKPKSTTDSTLNRNAVKLLDNTKIVAMLEKLRAPVRAKAQITLESHLDDLKRLRDIAEQENQLSSAISAEVSRGKASGLYETRVKVDADVTGYTFSSRRAKGS
ncbi:MAG: terminase small subunit [Spongiibacteraceae bacterium]